MNNGELIGELSRHLGYTEEEASHSVASLIDAMTMDLQEGKTVAVEGLGLFEVKKTLEHITVDPVTGKRYLVPPSLNLVFKSEFQSGAAPAEMHCLMPQNGSDAFAGTFFAAVKNALIQDKYVKIKGLGTFKLIDSDVSFVPDDSLRSLINRPFSQFESVELKEGVHFDDMDEPVREKGEPEETPVSETAPEADAAEKPKQEKQPRIPWCMLAVILLAGVLLGGSIVWALVSGRRYIPESVIRYIEGQETGMDESASSDTLALEYVPESASEQPAPEQVAIPAKENKPLSDTVKYEMKETLAEYVMRRGESLAKVAQRFYGNRKLWPYIARYNRKNIPDPDNVPVGTVVRIPRLIPAN